MALSFIGQTPAISQIQTTINACQERGVILPHTLLIAPPGCLQGDAQIGINRAGKGWTLPLQELVGKFNGEQNSPHPWDLSIPTFVQREVDGVVRLGRILNAWCSGEKFTYTVTTDTGRTVRATDEHPFLTERGWVRLDELVHGDQVHVNVGKPSGGRAKKKNYPNTYTRYHPRQRPTKDGFRVPTHRLTIEANLNGLSFEEYVHILRTDQKRCESFLYLTPDQHVHHRDGDPKNNNPDNLLLVTPEDHRAEHVDVWARNVLDQVDTESVVSVVPFGTETTYDIEVEDDPHNFIANGFVVHNTGKTRLAREIANELRAPFKTIAMPAEPRLLFMEMLDHRGVLLIDEVHQADRKTLDALLPFLVDGTVRWRRVEEKNPHLTIIAATTDPQKLPDAFTSRFRLRPSFGDYSVGEIAEIIDFTATCKYYLAYMPIAEGLAEASLGNPRQAVDILLPAYVDLLTLADYDPDSVSLQDVLAHAGITERGLRQEHLQYLRALRKQGGVASQATIARMVFMPEAAMNQIERDLLREGIIAISTLGRELRERHGWDPDESASRVDQVDVESDVTDTDTRHINPYTMQPLEPR